MTLQNDELEADVVHSGRERLLRVSATDVAALAPFDGSSAEVGARHLLEGRLSAANPSPRQHGGAGRPPASSRSGRSSTA